MVRSPRAALPDEQALARVRLEALGLAVVSPGWVPEPVESAEWPGRGASAAPAESASVGAATVAPGPPTVGDLVRGWLLDRVPVWAQGSVERVRVGTVVSWLATAVAIVVIGIVLFGHHAAGAAYSAGDSSPPASGSASAPSDSAAPAASPTGSSGVTAAGSIVVDVGGRVRKPGLVTLPAGSRVADAIAAAGGPLHHREVATIDLAARVSDGQLLLVGVSGASSTAGESDLSGETTGSDSGPAEPVGLNAATLEQLETLPGVGPVTAQKIVDWRTANNGFTDVSQLQQVPGIGPAKYAELSALVTP